METATSKKPLDIIVSMYDVHTKLFPNVIEGISAEDATNRLNSKANHIGWIAGSIVFSRYEFANALTENPDAHEHKQTSYELFKDWKGIQDAAYPPLEEYKKDWEKITPVLRNALLNIPNEKLDETAPVEMGEKVTFSELVMWNMHREAYLIGQVGLWRRLLGYEAMKYQ